MARPVWISTRAVPRHSGRVLGRIERFMTTEAVKIGCVVAGVILLAVGFLNLLPDILRFFRSNTASSTLMIRTHWILVVVCGALLCIVSLFVKRKQG